MRKRRSLLGLATLPLFAALALPAAPVAAQEPFVGEVILVGFNFCPRGFAKAEGQLLAIAQNQALFSLYGTMYGGDGRTTFALPDLRGRNVISQGDGPGLNTYRQGQRGGSTSVTLTQNTLPSHNHVVRATNAIADKTGPGGKLLAATGSPTEERKIYVDGPANRTMRAEMIGNTGGGLPFSVENPFLAMQYCVALTGIFPSRN